MKKLLAFLLVLIIVGTNLLPVYAEDAASGILDELEAGTVGGKPFNFADYPKIAGADAQLLAFAEVGYSYSGNQSGYGLYIYVYNPSEKTIIESGKNKVTMAVKYDSAGVARGWEKFDLQFVDKTSNNRFYKFLVVDHASAHDGNKIVQRVDRAARTYGISEIELQYVGNANALTVSVAQSFTFTGYQESGNLGIKAENVLTFEIDNLSHTYWRSKSSSLGFGHQNQLNTVYFPVSKALIAEYGTLNAMKASWNEQKTMPIVLLNSMNVYNELLSWVGVDIGKYNKDCPYNFMTREYTGADALFYNYGGWATPGVGDSRTLTILPYVFYKEKFEKGKIGVSSKELLDHIQAKNYADWLFAEKVDEGRTKGYQEVLIDAGDLFDLKSFGSTHSWWLNFFSHGLSWNKMYDDFENVAPIVEVTSKDLSSKSDSVVAAEFFIAEEDVPDLRKAVTAAEKQNQTIWMFRFAATDYYTYELEFGSTSWTDWSSAGCQGYYALETAFLDFDVIYLTFGETVVPVVMSPIDIVAPVTDPVVGPLVSDFPDASFVKKIISLIAVVLVVVILWKPVMKLFSVSADLVSNMAGDVRQSIRNIKGNKKGGKK